METTIQLETTTCPHCHRQFAMYKHFLVAARTDGQGFHCPYCGIGLSWKGQSENDRLNKELMKERAAHDQTKAHLETQRIATEGEAAKVERLAKKLDRVKCGVCPKCNRQFKNLRDHMKHEHGTAAEKAAVVESHKPKAKK